MPYSPDLGRLLTEGARYRDEQDEYVIERHAAGEVRLPTGQVVGCDPLTDVHAVLPFTVTARAGAYPLYVWVAVLYRDGIEQQRRVAALQLVVSDGPLARYRMAITAGQDLAELDEDSHFGFPVGAGTATLADLTAVRALADWDYERLDATFIPTQIPIAPVPGGIFTAITDEPTGANVTVVASGWGDGLYPTFIGYAPSGAVSAFIIDFMVVPHDALFAFSWLWAGPSRLFWPSIRDGYIRFRARRRVDGAGWVGEIHTVEVCRAESPRSALRAH